ncbi:unknown (plasmid) [Haloarcula marismortui ATCC 43049]|uniref:Uncharacterized protein n=1 Tax=Haloarcula marismortui (strain ATCC 43049 / DSM 3752 / JCM 8966 / VKM B-1809) TaxID=272569 RepID=Q5V613_HALMA|nr:unknown [Haloarcula marismortui ATCC 43049]
MQPQSAIPAESIAWEEMKWDVPARDGLVVGG